MLHRPLLALLIALLAAPLCAQPAPSYILDADTGNEMDDLYAIARALAPDGLKILALQSAHFNNPQLLTDPNWHIYSTENINTVAISQHLNEQLTIDCRQWMVPKLRGCDRMLGYAWGFYEGAPIPRSPATQFLIDHARKASPDDKLNIICLGASTNVAAALAQRPELAANMRVYLLAAKYDSKSKTWNKNSFNVRNDLNAFDLLLDNEDLELWIMPGNVARQLTFSRSETAANLNSCASSPLCRRLGRRWGEVSAGKEWIMWDLALVQALITPELATYDRVRTPPENTKRKIYVYTQIDAPAMRTAFWDALLSWQGN